MTRQYATTRCPGGGSAASRPAHPSHGNQPLSRNAPSTAEPPSRWPNRLAAAPPAPYGPYPGELPVGDKSSVVLHLRLESSLCYGSGLHIGDQGNRGMRTFAGAPSRAPVKRAGGRQRPVIPKAKESPQGCIHRRRPTGQGVTIQWTPNGCLSIEYGRTELQSRGAWSGHQH